MSAPLTASAPAADELRRLVRPAEAGSFGLTGVWHLRAGHATIPPGAAAAVLAPGWAGDRCGPGEIFLPMAAGLVRTAAGDIGGVLRFDVCGRGEAGGEYGQSDLDAMVDDGLRALALAAATANATVERPATVHLIGMCSGGNVALGAAGLWARLQAQDDRDCAHLGAEVVARLRTVRLKTVQAISTFPFQEMRPEELNAIRKQQNRRRTMAKLFRLDSYKKLLTGRLNPTRILKSWFESEPGAKAAAGGGSGGAAAAVNPKQSRRDLLDGLAKFAQAQPDALQFVYADGDPEGVASIPVYQAFFTAVGTAPAFTTLPGCNHNFYGRAAQGNLFAALQAFIQS